MMTNAATERESTGVTACARCTDRSAGFTLHDIRGPHTAKGAAGGKKDSGQVVLIYPF